MPDTPCEPPHTTAPGTRRRQLLALFGAGIAAATLPRAVWAQPIPTMKRIAAGRNYVSWQFGELKIVALRDGHVDMPPARLRQVNGEALGALPPGMPLADGKLRLSVNAYVVIEKSRAILIDTGAADTWAPSMGLLPEAMQEAGIDKNSITQVAITHTHRDHVNGLITAEGTDGFPNAQQIYVPREEIATITGRL
ncbi:MBL fold metallo-hydrolase, partial [Massilia oculi]|uniref:MBL fold metallo-hydrolase n=1 Tax=Massilia oculi TaxID=945844 RepID=UPI0028A7FA0D